MKLNKTIEKILDHRSIRKWKDEEVEDEVLETLYNVANRTATSMGMQAASVIRVVDKEKREEISKVSNQKYIVEVPELWIFIVDNYRNHKILEETKSEIDYTNDADKFLASYTDAALMAQNVANAAESLDLGTVFFGSILNDARRIIEILDLPEQTFPVVGLGFGYPDQKPELKPRMNYENRIFVDSYKNYDNYHEEFKEYDKRMSQYYDLRNSEYPVPEFTEQVSKKYTKLVMARPEVIKIALEQGFDFGFDEK